MIKDYGNVDYVAIETPCGKYIISTLIDFQNGVFIPLKDWVSIVIKNNEGKEMDYIDNPSYITETMLPALTAWKKNKIEPSVYNKDYEEIDSSIPKEDRNIVRKLIKDAIQKGML